MSLPVDPPLRPILHSFQRLRRALVGHDSPGHVAYYRDQVIHELGRVRGPSEYLLIARNQLQRASPRELDVRLLDTLEDLVFGGRVQDDDSVEATLKHPLEGSLQWALGKAAPFFTPELCRSAQLIHEFLQHQAALAGLLLLQDALVLPPAALSELTRSPSPEVREWAQAVIDATTP